MSASWDTSFAAVSVLVGEPVDAVTSALGDAASPQATALLGKLADASRDARARALARVISEVAVAIDAMRLA
jgi:hypothetical protein